VIDNNKYCYIFAEQKDIKDLASASPSIIFEVSQKDLLIIKYKEANAVNS